MMKPELRRRIIAYNQKRAKANEARDDLLRLVQLIPDSIISRLSTAARELLEKYAQEGQV